MKPPLGGIPQRPPWRSLGCPTCLCGLAGDHRPLDPARSPLAQGQATVEAGGSKLGAFKGWHRFTLEPHPPTHLKNFSKAPVVSLVKLVPMSMANVEV